MPRTDEADWWFTAVYEAVQQIPYGRVTSYGHIAKMLGYPQRSRQVGVCLKHLPSYTASGDHYFHDQNIPWQRVINSRGMISPRGPGAAARQATELRREGVEVSAGPLGELSVDFSTNGWFPRSLPGEEGDYDTSSDAESN